MNSNTPPPQRHNYIPEIDTLRAVAVGLVVLFHAFPALAPGGYIGVDIFFVISGFVISRSYLEPLLSRKTTLREFYTARFRRLAPALFVVLLLTTIAAYVFVLPSEMQLYAKSLIAQPFYLQNFVFWNEGDYFQAATTKPLLHTWSLAVEEQFYIFFGLAILLLKPAPRLFLPILLLAAIGSVFVGIILEPISPKTAFFMLPTRVWQLALGIFVYVIAKRIGQRNGTWIDMIALFGLLVSVATGFLFSEDAPYPGPHAYIACMATALTLFCFDIGPGKLAVLRLAPIRYLGRISYGFYLWHWPPIAIFYLTLDRSPDVFEALALVALAFVGAVLSFHLIEQPIRQRRALVSTEALKRFVLGGMVTTTAAGMILYMTDGAIFRYPAEMRPFFAATVNHGNFRCPKSFRVLNPNAELCPITDNASPTGVLVLGDSHADVLDEMLAEIADRMQLSLYLTVRVCDLGMYDRTKYCSRDTLEKLSRQAKAEGISHILAISRWPQEWMIATDFEDQVGQLLDDGFDVTIMESVPYGPYFDPIQRVRAALSSGELSYDGLDKDIYTKINITQRTIFENTVARFGDRVHILKPGAYLCPEDECLFQTDGKPNYMDSKHLNFTGRQLLVPMFEAFFAAIRKRMS